MLTTASVLVAFLYIVTAMSPRRICNTDSASLPPAWGLRMFVNLVNLISLCMESPHGHQSPKPPAEQLQRWLGSTLRAPLA